jgi:hypothetical protein
LDLDPNNIEKINVLKGFAAATLYGTAGKTGDFNHILKRVLTKQDLEKLKYLLINDIHQ